MKAGQTFFFISQTHIILAHGDSDLCIGRIGIHRLAVVGEDNEAARFLNSRQGRRLDDPVEDIDLVFQNVVGNGGEVRPPRA